MSLEETLAALFDAKIAPLRAELQLVTAELAAVRRALPPQLVLLKVAARLMNVSVKTARRRCDSGEWPSRKDGRNVLVDVSALRPKTDEEIASTAQRLRALPGGNHGQE